MAGFTAFSAGLVNNSVCYIPIEELFSGNYVNRVNINNRNWQRLLEVYFPEIYSFFSQLASRIFKIEFECKKQLLTKLINFK